MSRPKQAHRADGLTNKEKETLALCGNRHNTPEFVIALVYQMLWESAEDKREVREPSAVDLIVKHTHRAALEKDSDFFRRLADAIDEVSGRSIPGGGVLPAHPVAFDVLKLWREGRRTTAEFKKGMRIFGHDVDSENAWSAIRAEMRKLLPKVKRSKGGRPRGKSGLKRK